MRREQIEKRKTRLNRAGYKDVWDYDRVPVLQSSTHCDNSIVKKLSFNRKDSRTKAATPNFRNIHLTLIFNEQNIVTNYIELCIILFLSLCGFSAIKVYFNLAVNYSK